MYRQPLTEGEFFHIYNRGVNGESIFKEIKNYYFFLEQYKHYCSQIFDTYAYCLLKNHFHLVLYINENIEVPRNDGNGMYKLDASKQLSHFFNSYAQSINKSYQRTGQLFESSFERRLVDSDGYLKQLIYYIHNNPVHHGFTSDMSSWEFSSYQEIIKVPNNSFLAIDKILACFGGIENFKDEHKRITDEGDLSKYVIER